MKLPTSYRQWHYGDQGHHRVRGCLLVTIQLQQLVLIGSGSLLRLWAGCTVVAFYGFIQGINLPASTFNRATHTMIFMVSRVLKRTPRTGLSREGPCAERDRRNPAACSHRINHFAASWRLLHQGWLAIGKYWAEIQQLALMTKFCLPSCHTMARARHEQRCLSLWIERVVPRCLSLGDGLSINLLGK